VTEKEPIVMPYRGGGKGGQSKPQEKKGDKVCSGGVAYAHAKKRIKRKGRT